MDTGIAVEDPDDPARIACSAFQASRWTGLLMVVLAIRYRPAVRLTDRHISAFVQRENSRRRATPPWCQEIALHLATEVTPLWQASEETLQTNGLPPPYWAFAWPGGQTFARLLLDRPELARGRKVLDFASGCGIAAIAAAKAGAAQVVATEIDAFAVAALRPQLRR